MKRAGQIAITIRWTARIWGGINLLFLFFMFGANILAAISNPSSVSGNDFSSSLEMISFLFFPASTIIGLSIGLKWDGIGGIITIGGIIGFHIIHPEFLLDPLVDGLAAPGLLFLISWLLSLGNKKAKTIKIHK